MTEEQIQKRKEYRKEYQKKYQKKYQQTEKNKEYKKKYQQSDRGKEVRAAAQKRFWERTTSKWRQRANEAKLDNLDQICENLNIHGKYTLYRSCAGSGKTQTLINYIIRLVKAGVPLNRIAFISHTNVAVNEAKERITRALNVEDKGLLVYFSTIHAMVRRSLVYHGYTEYNDKLLTNPAEDEGFQIYKRSSHFEYKQYPIIPLSKKEEEETIAMADLIRMDREEGMRRMEADLPFLRPLFVGTYGNILKDYKEETGKRDFIQMFQDYLKYELTEDVDFVFLDEMQDATILQWKICFQAYKDCKHMFIAADLLQNLYGGMGASNLYVQEHVFPLIPKENIIDLNVSYRCPQRILDFVQDNVLSQLIKTKVPVKLYAYNRKNSGVIYYILQKPYGKGDKGPFPTEEHSRQMGWDELRERMWNFPKTDTAMILSWMRRRLECFAEFLLEYRIPFKYNGYPIISKKMIAEFKQNGKVVFPTRLKNHFYDPQWRGGRHLFKIGDLEPQINQMLEHYSEEELRNPRVELSTIHGAKGREADWVVFDQTTTRRIDYHRYEDPGMWDEAYFLAYVACTRAKKGLIIFRDPEHEYMPLLDARNFKKESKDYISLFLREKPETVPEPLPPEVLKSLKERENACCC